MPYSLLNTILLALMPRADNLLSMLLWHNSRRLSQRSEIPRGCTSVPAVTCYLCRIMTALCCTARLWGKEILAETSEALLLRVGGGEPWDDFVAYCVEHGYYGLENLSLIPGEVGASAVQNVGAYGVEAGDCTERVETVEIATGRECVFSHDDCQYAYRSSFFKHEAHIALP